MKSCKSLAFASLATWLLGIGDAFAQAATTTATTAVAPASPMASMMQGLVGLVIVVGLIFAAAWVMKKIAPRNRSSGVVQVVGGASVGPREKVVVVRFGHQTLLLGVAPGQVSLLHTADASELTDMTPETPSNPPAPRFIDRLRAARGKA
jgi:flagellar protein FliO/FliZ